MALRALILNKKIEQKRSELSSLKEKATEIEKRSQELEEALEEAATDEEVKTVEEEAEKLEGEKKENDEAMTALENEITGLEAELEEARSSSKVNKPQKEEKPQNQERGEYKGMSKRGIFAGLTLEQRSAFVQREDVKEFLQRARELKQQKRGVNGAELGIPEVVLSLIRDNLHKYSKLLNKVSLKPVSGTARQPISGAIPEGIWTEMVANLNEADISFNEVEVDGYKVGSFIPVPNSTLEDSDFNLASEILEMLAQGIGLAVDRAILFGTGVRMPLGIATRLAQTSQPSTWGANAPAWTDLHSTNILKWDGSAETGATFFANLVSKLGVANSKYSNGELFWCMNTKTKLAIMAKAITFDAAGALVASVNNTMPFVGGEIVVLDFIADNDIIGGYGSLYLLAERAGASLATSDQCRFIQDQTVFKGTARYDGIPVFGEGFVIVNFANTNPTTSSTFAGDSANTDLVSLSALTIGTTPVTLFPPFNKDVLNYRATVTAHANKINATALKTGATVSIKNGSTAVTSGSNATFTSGENTLTVEVTNGNATKRTYTVVVIDETA